MLVDLATAESGLDVTTLMLRHKQTPGLVFNFVREMVLRSFVTEKGTHLKITVLGREYVHTIISDLERSENLAWKQVPEGFRAPQTDAFQPYLPRRSEVDPEIFRDP